ncbi:U4/U5/U6 small nuclear ribonucleoprotein prp3 [Coemansia sp. RSA 552]|nr:U4/U5/U6 small nuclear ribonucleoprotein prp3 [Coemansia sp. RSA 552]
MSQRTPEELQALIAAKRAEAQARLAKMNLPSVASSGRPPARPPQASSATPETRQPGATVALDAVAAMRARIEARLKSQGLAASSSPTAPSTDRTSQSHPTELHPMLRADYKAPAAAGPKGKRPRLAAMPRISSVKANQRPQPAAPAEPEPAAQMKVEHEIPAAFTDPSQNPYFDPALGQRAAGPQNRRRAKQFNFVRPGRYVEQGEKRRAEAKVEQLKAEIEERAAKARLEDEVLDATAIRLPEPPAVEWWDAPFIGGQEYDDSKCKLDGPDTLVTIYVQHPIPIEPPLPIRSLGQVPAQLILTRKERKRIRRQRRLEQHREHRDKVMLGLLPPEPPKLRISNFMRIMANESVPDPTKLEAEVRRQMDERLHKHEAENQARKLTKEQRRDKSEKRVAEDETRGIITAVFRVAKLSHPQHRYKVSVNARQMHLTGTALACPQMSLVIVEGSAKNIKAYKKLMLRRIDWTTERDPVQKPDVGEAQGPPEVDYSDNECCLIWQGEAEAKKFAQFRIRDCPTESQAKNWLAGAGCDSLWQLAQQYDPNDSITALDPFV